MSYYHYMYSRHTDVVLAPFYSLIMAAMRKADHRNLAKLQTAWPGVWDELQARYNAPGGYLKGEAPLDLHPTQETS